jgi:hypothetical protein
VQNFPRENKWHQNCKRGDALFHNILLHFITYYPTVTQLGFILSVNQSCIKKF